MDWVRHSTMLLVTPNECDKVNMWFSEAIFFALLEIIFSTTPNQQYFLHNWYCGSQNPNKLPNTFIKCIFGGRSGSFRGGQPPSNNSHCASPNPANHNCHLSGRRRASNSWPRVWLWHSPVAQGGGYPIALGALPMYLGVFRGGVSTRRRGNDHCEVGLQSTELCLRARPLVVWLRINNKVRLGLKHFRLSDDHTPQSLICPRMREEKVLHGPGPITQYLHGSTPLIRRNKKVIVLLD